MRAGTAFAVLLCIGAAGADPGPCAGAGWGRCAALLGAPAALGSGHAPDSSAAASEAVADTAARKEANQESGESSPDSSSVAPGDRRTGARDARRLGFRAQMAAYRSLWERLAEFPEVRWAGGSGGLGGLEALAIRGRLMRRPGVMVAGAPLGPDLNVTRPATLDSVRIVSGISLYSEVFMDGAEGVEVLYAAHADEPRAGYLSLGRGGFASRFSAFSYGQWEPSWSYRLNFAGASFGRAASYDGYTSDGGAVSGGRRFDSGLSLGVHGSRFKSKVIRYTADKTKTGTSSLALSAGVEAEDGVAWLARMHYLGAEYSYSESEERAEDDVWRIGGSLDFWPEGTEGVHRVSVGIRRESVERSWAPFVIPEELAMYGPLEEGERRSLDASALYAIKLGAGKTRVTGLARLDRKELFGWAPTFAAGLSRSLGRWGSAGVECGRAAYMPAYFDIYAPRDEAARPTWFMAGEMEPESEWNVSGNWVLPIGSWTASAGGFAALREHVLSPPSEWLGLNGSTLPAVAAPLVNIGDGSAAGFWTALDWAGGPTLKAGASYSAQRSRAGGKRAVFQPAHKAGLWAWGERRYFGGDMRLGLIVRGYFYSSQGTYLDVELPSYGVGESLGYVAISDVVFFCQFKNLETRSRPSYVLDRQAGIYLAQPAPELRFGLVWYLPG